ANRWNRCASERRPASASPALWPCLQLPALAESRARRSLGSLSRAAGQASTTQIGSALLNPYAGTPRQGQGAAQGTRALDPDVRRSGFEAQALDACAARISVRSLRGVIGSESTFTRSGRSASSMAAQIAGGAPMRPPSPPPLIPYSVYGEGVSTWPTRTFSGSS